MKETTTIMQALNHLGFRTSPLSCEFMVPDFKGGGVAYWEIQ